MVSHYLKMKKKSVKPVSGQNRQSEAVDFGCCSSLCTSPVDSHYGVALLGMKVCRDNCSAHSTSRDVSHLPGMQTLPLLAVGPQASAIPLQ